MKNILQSTGVSGPENFLLRKLVSGEMLEDYVTLPPNIL
jgi:hypothetical protein